MSEALTGRKKTFFLFPISYKETVLNSSSLEAKRMLDTRLIYGLYPEVVNNPGNEKEILVEIANSYLYKDILQIEGIRKPAHIENLLRALAFQVGNEVSYNEEDGVLNAFEIKWKDKKVKFPNSFLKAYPNHTTTAVNQSNFVSFVDE